MCIFTLNQRFLVFIVLAVFFAPFVVGIHRAVDISLSFDAGQLVCRTNFNMPRRTSAGTDYNRVNLLLAVMEKRIGLHLGDCDAYINVAGGMRINEPALDMGIVLGVLSSYKNIAIDSKTICFGEVGLVGEVRAVNQAEQRVLEAAKLGFDRCIMPKVNCESLSIDSSQLKGMKLVGVKSIYELLEEI